MERKVGEIFIYKDKTYQVVEVETDEECKGCAFEFSSCCTSLLGDCSPTHRTDSASVIFKEINNMENNQLTIDIPEGMEIDLEKSNLAKGIIKFRSKWLTIAEIISCEWSYSSITVSALTRKKIIAISNLMDIAKYFNGDWKYKVNGSERDYMIAYDKTRTIDDGYQVVHINSDTDMYFGNIMFKNEADAQYVINNPNFRDILNVIYKN